MGYSDDMKDTNAELCEFCTRKLDKHSPTEKTFCALKIQDLDVHGQ